jgi:hypothetical protein
VTSQQLNAMRERQMWHKIRIDAANDPALKEMLDQVVTFWKLKYDSIDYKSKKDESGY